LRFSVNCQSVVACRCAPSQKAQLVMLVKRNVSGATTLAIGDGANDVAMIQAAHVGVGISGQEGMQAANSADFSFGQFRFLTELFFVYGRNSYRRVATLVLYIFYKNIMMTLVTYCFLFHSAASGQRIYVELGVQLYNVFYTAWPILVYGLVDCDVSKALSRTLPQLYHIGVRKAYFNVPVVIRWSFECIMEAMVVFYTVVPSVQKMKPVLPLPPEQPTGQDPSVIHIGDAAYSSILLIVSLKLMLRSYQVTLMQWSTIAICVVLWWSSAFIANQEWLISASTFEYSMVRGYTGMWSTSNFDLMYWLLVLLVTIAVLLPSLFLRTWQRAFYPEFRDLAMEVEYHRLENEQLRLWNIPMVLRRLSLRKDAPRGIEQVGCFPWPTCWCQSVHLMLQRTNRNTKQ